MYIIKNKNKGNKGVTELMSVDVYMRTGSNITHMAFEDSHRGLYIYCMSFC